MQDIKPKERRSIRNITLPGNRKPRPVSTSTPSSSDDTPLPPVRKNSMNGKSGGGGGRKLFFALIIIVVLILGAGALMTVFGNTTVTIVPKTASAEIDKTITAAPTGTSATTTAVLYQEINLEDTLSKEVPATGEKYVEEKAQGTIIVYNDFDKNPQRLITNTRFETPEGLIYRIRESIVVPGQTTVNGETKPGSIEVTVYADEPGETYNISLSDFTVPGFKGDPRYDKFYARSKTAMTGGFVGNKKQVAEGIYNDTVRELDTTLRANLLGSLQSQIPQNLTILEDLVTFTFEDAPQEVAGENVKLTRKGTITAPLFDKQNLAKELSSQTNVPHDVPMIVDSYNTLTITKSEDTDVGDVIEFHVNGTATFVGVVNQEEVATALAGKEKSSLPTVLANFPGIASARATISPFWIGSFPENPEDINLIIEKE